MDTLLNALFAASLAAAALGILYWMRKKPGSEGRWHVFYSLYQRDDNTYSPLYRVGCDVGTRSIPLLMVGVDFEWDCVSGAGYETRDDAIIAASEIEAAHLRDLAALPESDELRDPDSTLFLPRMAQ